MLKNINNRKLAVKNLVVQNANALAELLIKNLQTKIKTVKRTFVKAKMLRTLKLWIKVAQIELVYLLKLRMAIVLSKGTRKVTWFLKKLKVKKARRN